MIAFGVISDHIYHVDPYRWLLLSFAVFDVLLSTTFIPACTSYSPISLIVLCPLIFRKNF
ncbi:hypothetical protein PRIPAC_82611 [Pristionchus pacificus]|uniref:Uncharacterized protein n=1 Tax=Pristionchus pacificus TaxID=54126 RepID=A0A2A6CQH2_PRIPA|nr:hypothetical protein PRIPAC_82611 [Pristionchus pacificus]|eukprot:PDM80307.1 hypothetical protein PRIPAC_32886 [Pristionchus pacificus]